MSYKSGFVSIVGIPNVGKSTFFNFLLEEDLAIVSAKAQATRKTCRGIYNTDEFQMVFLDAPGLVPAKTGLWNFLHQEFHKTLEEGDFVLFLIAHDQEKVELFEEILQKYESLSNWGVVWTKSDLKPNRYVKELKEKIKPELSFEFSVRETKRPDLKKFLNEVSKHLPSTKVPMFDPDWLTDIPIRDIVTEKIRQECFDALDQELPYGVAVIINSYKENQNAKNLTKIEATIIIEKENHKSIVIGKAGAKLKLIGTRARTKLEKFLDVPVYLGLHVSVKKDWQRNQKLMKELGYEHSKK